MLTMNTVRATSATSSLYGQRIGALHKLAIAPEAKTRCARPARPLSMKHASGQIPRAAPLAHMRRVQPLAAHEQAAGVGISSELKNAIDTVINDNKIVVFIKGSKQFPQCGFSNTVVQILNNMGVPYESVDILADERLRSGMKAYSQWPTFPQVYISGEFFGGCDILLQAYQSGELKETLERVRLE